MNETIEIIRTIFRDILGKDPAVVVGDVSLEQLGIDSLDMVQLVYELEDRCGIVFGYPEGITTIDELVAYVVSLRA